MVIAKNSFGVAQRGVGWRCLTKSMHVLLTQMGYPMYESTKC